jgi:hypothetical protein
LAESLFLSFPLSIPVEQLSGETTSSADEGGRQRQLQFFASTTHRPNGGGDDDGDTAHDTRTICRRLDASDAWRRDAHPRTPHPYAGRRQSRRACELTRVTLIVNVLAIAKSDNGRFEEIGHLELENIMIHI